MATAEESKWMLDRLPTLPGLPSVGPPPDALTSDGSTNYIHKNNNKSWCELPEDPLSKSRGGPPRQVSDQKNLYYLVEEASPEQFS